jgi:hypothetical protein
MVLGKPSIVWNTGEQIARGLAAMRMIDRTADVVRVMETYKVEFMLDMPNHPMIPENYSRQDDLKCAVLLQKYRICKYVKT